MKILPEVHGYKLAKTDELKLLEKTGGAIASKATENEAFFLGVRNTTFKCPNIVYMRRIRLWFAIFASRRRISQPKKSRRKKGRGNKAVENKIECCTKKGRGTASLYKGKKLRIWRLSATLKKSIYHLFDPHSNKMKNTLCGLATALILTDIIAKINLRKRSSTLLFRWTKRLCASHFGKSIWRKESQGAPDIGNE